MDALLLAPLLIAVITSLSLAIFVWLRPAVPGSVPFALLMVAITVWVISYSFRLASNDPLFYYLWSRISYFGIVAVPALWMLLTISYTGPKSWMRPWMGALLAVEPVMFIILVWTNPWHQLVWEQAFSSPRLFYAPDLGHGPAFWIHSFYSYLLLLAGSLLLFDTIRRSTLLYKGQSLALLVGAVTPWAGNVLYIAEAGPFPDIDLTPFLFALTSPILAYGLFHYRLLELTPISYDAILENMHEQVVVLDSQQRVTAANRAAEGILGQPIQRVIGQRAQVVLGLWPELLERLANLQPGSAYADRTQTVSSGDFDIHISTLNHTTRSRRGTMIVFHDVSERKQAEEQLRTVLAETEALYRVSRSLAQSESLPTMLQTIVDEVATALPANRVALITFNEERRTITHLIKGGPGQAEIGDIHFDELMEGLSGWVIRQRKPVLLRQSNPEWQEGLQVEPFEKNGIARGVMIAPVIYQGRLLGTITAENRPDQAWFNKKQLDLLVALANTAASGVETARLLLSERQQRSRAETLGEVAGVLNSNLDRQQLLNLILEQLVRVVEYDSASVLLLTPTRDSLSIAAHRQLRSGPLVTVPAEIGILPQIHQVLESRQALFIPDTRSDKRWHRDPSNASVRCWLAAPLLGQDQVIGLLTLERKQPFSYSNKDKHFVQAFANQAAIALENARLFTSEQQRAQEAETLRQAAAAVLSTLDQNEAIERILQQLERVVHYDSASVQLLHDGYLEIVGGRGWADPEAVLGLRFPVPYENPNTRVIQSGKPLCLGNAPEAYPRFREPIETKIISWLGAPLIIHDKVIGMIALDSYQPDQFDENDARLVSAFADQVAIAIENVRLYSSERQRVEESQALRATMADISTELELPKLLQAILERATSLLGATGGDLGLYQPERQEIEIVVSHNMGKDYTGTHMGLGEGAMGWVAENLEPLTVEDYTEWANRSEQYQEGPWHGVLAVPMLIGGRLIGVIGLVDTDPHRRFTDSDLRLLHMFAQQATIAVENARLYLSAREAAERRAVLHNVSQEIVAASLNPEAIYSAIHRAASRLMPTEAFAITLLDESDGMIDAAYVYDHGGRALQERFPADRGLSGHVIATGESVFIVDVLVDLQDSTSLTSQSLPVGGEEEVRSIIAAPMRLGDKVIGMLSAQSYRPSDYSSDDLSLLEMMASYAAIALENNRLFKEVQRLAITDPLTELYNRRYLFEIGQREFNRAHRFSRALSVIMIDIDHFKQVNDTYGHPTGDIVLQQLARRVQNCVREVDIVGRYGGEEFLLILPETDLEAAMNVSERIRSYIAQPVEVAGNPPLSITVSIGVASISPNLIDLSNLIAAADSAQYRAKNSGRNQVICYLPN